jgi:multiple sugar transport system permease protein
VIPVSTTVILIRMIEAFKLIDIPNVMMGGGPGTATETMTLYAYKSWKGLDLGLSAAESYLLLFVVTFTAMVFVNIVRRRVLEFAK